MLTGKDRSIGQRQEPPKTEKTAQKRPASPKRPRHPQEVAPVRKMENPKVRVTRNKSKNPRIIQFRVEVPNTARYSVPLQIRIKNVGKCV